MKKIIQILSVSFIVLFTACNKNDIHNDAEHVGISRVTHFPELSLNGEGIMTVPVGGTFTDPGATATVAGATAPYTTSGTVNTAVPGVYTVTYTAMNSDSFSTSVTRNVAVYQTDAGAAAHDLSGNYARTSNGSVAVWTKIAPGVYKVFNPGGAPGTNLTVVLFNPTGFTIKIPSQLGTDGNITSSSGETYSDGTPPQYSMVIVNPGYGASSRTFVKQ